MRLLYSLAFYLLVPAVLLRLAYRSLREPRYRETPGERFGFCRPINERGLVWVHAVSAGETNAAAPLVRRLLDAGYPVMITTMTPTGRERVHALFGDRVFHAWAPYDLPGSVARFLRRVQPACLVIIDTELWPNMVTMTKAAGASALLVNARLSDRSARGYARVPGLTRSMLAALDAVAVQTASHGERFLALGLASEKLLLAGSIKFDIELPPDIEERSARLRARIVGSRRVFLAASTHEGEEAAALEALAGLPPDVLLVLVPRHPHRSAAVQRLIASRNLTLARHSEAKDVLPGTRVLLVDTMGELMYFYAIADIAFVGGSLTPVGGHNPMEPAALGVPIIMGPHLRNIDDIATQFIDAGGLLVCDSAAALGPAARRLLDDHDFRSASVDAATRVMEANRGALDRVVSLVRSRLDAG